MRAPHPWLGHEKLQNRSWYDFLSPLFFLFAWMGALGTIAASQMQLRTGLLATRRSKISTKVRRGMSIQIVGMASTAPGSLYRFPEPPNVQPNDVVILFVHDRGSSGAVSMDFGTPVGWTKIGRAGEFRGALCAYKKIWQTGDQMPMINEMPGSVNTGSANGPSIQTQSASYAIRNANFNEIQASFGSGSESAAGLTPAVGSLLLFTNGSDWASSDPTPPSGFTQGAARQQTATGIIEGFYKSNVSATATGTVTPGGTMDSSANNSAILLSIPPGVVSLLSYTGSVQTVVVPAGAQSVLVDLYGAEGGKGGGGVNGGAAGAGNRLQARLPVTAGETLEIRVGQKGVSGGSGASLPGAAGGWNGGGNGGGGGSNSGGGAGAGGGGATDVRRGAFGLADRIAVAAAGAGGGSARDGVPGGYGGSGEQAGWVGQSSSGAVNPGQPGTASAGGNAGSAPAAGTAGTLGVGGTGGAGFGGGGGGGYYGGGGGGGTADSFAGTGAGGGGGSSYVDPSAVSLIKTQGARTGNGEATLIFSPVAVPSYQTEIEGETWLPQTNYTDQAHVLYSGGHTAHTFVAGSGSTYKIRFSSRNGATVQVWGYKGPAGVHFQYRIDGAAYNGANAQNSPGAMGVLVTFAGLTDGDHLIEIYPDTGDVAGTGLSIDRIVATAGQIAFLPNT